MQLRVLGPIGHCSARLRRALEIEEEQALQWKVRVRRIPEDEKTGPRGRRFTIAPRFAVPGPFGSRPESPLGHVSFHFSEDAVNKEPGGKTVVTSSSGRRQLSSTSIADHDGYVSRPDAVMTISAAEFGSYAERGSAVEISDSDRPAIFSNISDDSDVRNSFWLAVHEHEREAKPDRLVFNRANLSAAGWKALSELETLPDAVREIAARMAAMPPKSARKKGDAILELPLGEAYAVRRAVQGALGEWNWKKQPVRVAKGRNGRTQYRLTAEFPQGLDPAARVRITQQFCDEFAELGAMFTAAIHAPDAHNDERNHHLHFVYYDRPCAIVPGTGLWDFQIREKVPGQYNRYRFPHRQPKIAELTRDPNGGNYKAYRASVIFRWRERFAQLCNEELLKVGINRLFDARKYSEMGIDQEPTKPLGPRAAPLEAAGVPTPTGIANAEILWTAALEAARRECEKRRSSRQRLRTRLAEAAARLELGRSGGGADLRAKGDEIARLCEIIDPHELEIEEFRVTLEMAYSRPHKAVDTCSRILDAVEAGRGKRSDIADRELILARRAAADAFLADIDTIRDQSFGIIEPILERVEEARTRLSALRAEVQPIIKSVLDPATPVDQPHEVETCIEPTASVEKDRHASRPNPARDAIDGLLNRIQTEDIPILAPDSASPLFRVPGITREEYRLLSSERHAEWVQARLQGIAHTQQLRMSAAARMLRKHGNAGLERIAVEDADARRALRWIEAYRHHPALGGLLDVPVTVQVDHGPAPSAKVMTSDPIVETELRPVPPERAPAVCTASSEATSPHATQITGSDAVADEARSQAISSYAEAIRSDAKVVIVDVDGEQRVDPASVPDWILSAEVFADEGLVKEAIVDRLTADLDEARAPDRRKIIEELQSCIFRPLERIGDRWFVTGVSAPLVAAAHEWQDHPQLAEAYEVLDRFWLAREIIAADEAMEEAKRAEAAAASATSRSRQAEHAPDTPGELAGFSVQQQAAFVAASQCREP